MCTLLRKFVLGITVTMLAIAGVSAATASSAVATASPGVAAVPCGPSAPDKDPTTATTVNPVAGYVGPAMRTGPGLNCPILASGARPPWGSVVHLNCYRTGDTIEGVRTWSAVHWGGYFGWISDYHLYGRGSNYPC